MAEGTPEVRKEEAEGIAARWSVGDGGSGLFGLRRRYGD